MRGSFIQLFDEGDPMRSDVTLLAAALFTLGIPAAGERLLHFTTERKAGAAVRRAVWTFADESRCKRYSTSEMIAAWDNGDWLCKNPKHPLAIIRAALNYTAAAKVQPKYSIEERTRIETPDTWIETAMHNLLILLSKLPATLATARGIVRFGPEHAAYVPLSLPEKKKTELIKYVEHPSKRAALRTAA